MQKSNYFKFWYFRHHVLWVSDHKKQHAKSHLLKYVFSGATDDHNQHCSKVINSLIHINTGASLKPQIWYFKSMSVKKTKPPKMCKYTVLVKFVCTCKNVTAYT